MRTITALTILLLVVGCQDDPGKAIRVGMPLEEAKAILAEAGAEEVILQYMTAGGDVPTFYDVGDGRALLMGEGKADGSDELVVTSLEIHVFDRSNNQKAPVGVFDVESFQP